MKKIIAIDLFCGVGGLTRGFNDAGIHVVYGIDILNGIKRLYQKNNKGTLYLHRDIRTIDSNEVQDLLNHHKDKDDKTMLAGCAPCQPFSTKNKNRKHTKGERRTLIDSFADLIQDVLPDFVFMENVPGIRSCQSGTFERFLTALQVNNYQYSYDLIDAASYGVPQHRKRLVLIARREEGKITIPKGEHDGIRKPFKTVKQTIGSLPAINAGMVHKELDNHRAAGLSTLSKKRIQATEKDGGNRLAWDSSLWLKCHRKTSGFKDVYARMHWDRPSPTLTTRFYSYSTGRYGHPEQDRAISLKEGALLQSFPPDYEFGTDLPMSSIGKQIGNAVPPKMAEAIGKYILSLC